MISVIIVGAGPAGLAAAIQLKRYGIDALLLERDTTGGLLRNANLVENYPGFPGGISGIELVRLFEQQAYTTGVHVTQGEVVDLRYNGDAFEVATREDTFRSQVAVIATGTRAELLTDPQISAEVSELVHYEVVPLLEQRGKRIAIIGAGDAAFDYALNLSRHNRVTILNRSERVKCLPLLWERAQAKENIRYLANHAFTEIVRDGTGGLKLSFRSPAGSGALRVDYLVAALGRQPRLDFTSREVLARKDTLERQGVLYFIGDVKNDIYRQTSIAVGDGVRAAMRINEWFKEQF